jgi:hypothetical protein
MRGFPHSDDPERTVMEELRVGVTLSGWSPVVWIPMKGIPRAVKPREEGPIPNNIKPYETRTPNTELATDRALILIDSWIWMFKKF